MWNRLSTSALRGHAGLALACLLIFLLGSDWANAKGQGPIGLWAASNRHVLVADKHLTGLVLVDLESSKATERLPMEGVSPKGVASCPNCDFALVSGSKGDFWLVHFQDKLVDLLNRTGKLGFDNARLELLRLEHPGGQVTDGRMLRISDDGKSAFIASSEEHAVYRVDFSAKTKAIPIIYDKKVKPFGINWDKNGDLLVAMHKRNIWRITAEGKVLATYNIRVAGCPGARELKPNLRAAVDDPINDDSILVLASNPKSYDAVVWRVKVDKRGKQSCTIAAGRIGRDPGWVDASGENIIFSRPHYFVPRPDSQPVQLIISDIDNHALRLLDLDTDTATTVMYDRDRRVKALPALQLKSAVPCDEQEWPNSAPAVAPSGGSSCARPPSPDALELTLAEAEAHCKAEGARLCEPTELRHAQVASNLVAWTNVECASCWHRNASDQCAVKIDTHKTPGIVHGHKDFSQSWNSGHALERGSSLENGPATICRPTDSQLRAAAPCCADEV